MIHALTSDNYKNITKVSILDAKAVFYPLKFVLQKKDISFNEDLSITIIPLAEEIKYPSISKLTDSGILRDCKFEISINNQSRDTTEKLEQFINKKVILVLHHKYGKIIIGCNEMPLTYTFDDDNTSSSQMDNGFSITCRGNSYFLKVSV